MEGIKTIIIFFICGALVGFGLWISIEWLVHRAMTKEKDSLVGIGVANYKQFITEFEKVRDEMEYIGNGNGFGGKAYSYKTGRKHYYYASIIYFNHIGMLMRTPWDFFMVERYTKKYADYILRKPRLREKLVEKQRKEEFRLKRYEW